MNYDVLINKATHRCYMSAEKETIRYAHLSMLWRGLDINATKNNEHKDNRTSTTI